MPEISNLTNAQSILHLTEQSILWLMEGVWARNQSVFLDRTNQWWVFNKGWRQWRKISWPLMSSCSSTTPRPGTYVNCRWKHIAETCVFFFYVFSPLQIEESRFPNPQKGLKLDFFTPREHICGCNISSLTLQWNLVPLRTSVVV